MGRGVIEVPFNEVVTLVKDIQNNYIWDKFIVVSLWRRNKSLWCVSTKGLGLGSIILGIIGAPEHQELCWHSRYTFLIRWPEHCKIAISFSTVHVASFPVTSFLCLQQESSLEDSIQLPVMLEYNHCMRKARILIIPTFIILLSSFFICICVKSI